jgi:hypothetical protein
MKLILLICLIGAAMSANLLTTGTGTLWTMTYLTPAATTTSYNLTLAYSTGVTTGTTQVSASAGHIGVVCIITTSNFTLTAASTANLGFAFGTTSTAITTINNVTGWGPLTLSSYNALTYTSDTTLVTGSAAANVVSCTLLTPTAPTWAAYVHTYTFSSTSVCANVPLKSASWTARCFNKVTNAVLTTAVSATLTVSAARNVTVGASTFAAGATILAGIAYLQF